MKALVVSEGNSLVPRKTMQCLFSPLIAAMRQHHGLWEVSSAAPWPAWRGSGHWVPFAGSEGRWTAAATGCFECVAVPCRCEPVNIVNQELIF